MYVLEAGSKGVPFAALQVGVALFGDEEISGLCMQLWAGLHVGAILGVMKILALWVWLWGGLQLGFTVGDEGSLRCGCVAVGFWPSDCMRLGHGAVWRLVVGVWLWVSGLQAVCAWGMAKCGG